MKRIILLIAVVAFLASCSKKNSTSGVRELRASNAETVLTILNKHNSSMEAFETTSIRSTGLYEKNNQKQRFGLDIYIQKDSKVVVNVRFLGITIVKGMVTPEVVQYYNTWEKTYFEGSFDLLSQWLGMDLDFYRFQNLLLGQLVQEGQDFNSFTSSIEEGLHKLAQDEDEVIQSAYFFEDHNGLLKREEISEKLQSRRVVIDYPSYQKIGRYLAPNELKITVEQKDHISLNLRYDKVVFNEGGNFSYKVPSGYKRITFN